MAIPPGTRIINTSGRTMMPARGKLADIIVVDGNPLLDIVALAHVQTVVKGGKAYQE